MVGNLTLSIITASNLDKNGFIRRGLKPSRHYLSTIGFKNVLVFNSNFKYHYYRCSMSNSVSNYFLYLMSSLSVRFEIITTTALFNPRHRSAVII